MKKDTLIFIFVLLIPVTLAAMLFVDNILPPKIINKPQKRIAAYSVRDDLVSIYTAEIGVIEATGKNDGKRIGEYLASCGLPEGYEWCAAFAHWCLNEVGIEGGGAYSPSWFPDKKTVYVRGAKGNRSPSQTDILGIYFPEKKRIAHIGFIDEWGEGDYLITVEGNTGGREGDGVYRKRRLKNQIYKVSVWI